MRSLALLLIAIVGLALAEALSRDAPSELSQQSREVEVATVTAQQKRVEQLAQQITDRSKLLQEKMANLGALQTQLAVHDDELLEKQKLLAAEQFVSSHHAVDLQKEQDKVAAAQQQLLVDQQRLSELQKVLTYMRSPAFKRLERAKELNEQKQRQQRAAEEHSKQKLEESSLSLFNPSSSSSSSSSSSESSLLSESAQQQSSSQQINNDVPNYAEVTDFLKPGMYLLEGKVFADSGLKDSPAVIMKLEEDGSMTGFAEETQANQRVTSQIVGKYSHLGLEWVQLRGSSISSCVGTFLPGSGAVTGTFSSPSGEQGSFDLSMRSVVPNGAAYLQFISHPFLQGLPNLDNQRVSGSAAGSTLSPGFFRSQGKTVNSVTGKETELPTFAFQLRADGTLSGVTTFMPGARNGENVVRVAGHWTAKDLLFVFRFGGKVFHFKGSPSNDPASDVIGGEYLFGKRGKGRFAFHFQRVQL